MYTLLSRLSETFCSEMPAVTRSPPLTLLLTDIHIDIDDHDYGPGDDLSETTRISLALLETMFYQSVRAQMTPLPSALLQTLNGPLQLGGLS